MQLYPPFISTRPQIVPAEMEVKKSIVPRVQITILRYIID